jgi:hypothetical protein
MSGKYGTDINVIADAMLRGDAVMRCTKCGA